MSYPPGPPGDEPSSEDAGSHERPAPPAYDPYAAGPPPTPYPPPGYPLPEYGYGYPGYGYPPGVSTNGKATTALVIGITTLVLSWCCGFGLVGIVAIVLGARARGEIRRAGGRQEGDGLALAGIITGAVATAIGVAALVAIGIALARAGGGGGFNQYG